MVSSLTLGLVFVLAVLASSALGQRTIRLNSDGNLKTLFFSDVHFGEPSETSGT